MGRGAGRAKGREQQQRQTLGPVHPLPCDILLMLGYEESAFGVRDGTRKGI